MGILTGAGAGGDHLFACVADLLPRVLRSRPTDQKRSIAQVCRCFALRSSTYRQQRQVQRLQVVQLIAPSFLAPVSCGKTCAYTGVVRILGTGLHRAHHVA